MNPRTLAILILATMLLGCSSKNSKQGTDPNLQGDETRDKIQNNKMNVGLNIFDNKWPVQFMIDAENLELTISALNTISECVMITDFVNHEISPAEVHSWKAKMKLFNDTINISKMTHSDWELPIYSFNWEESFDQVKSDSKIEKIELALYQNKIEYTLVDYLKD